MRLPILTLAGILCASIASADVMVGTADPGTGNCIPFACSEYAGTTYQQLYASSSFSGPLTITSLTFFNTQVAGGSLAPGTFTLSLSTVNASVGTFSSVIAQGGDATQIFSGSLPVLPFGGSMTLGSGSFNYDPSAGNLLLNVDLTGVPPVIIGQFLDAMNGTAAGLFSRASTGVMDPKINWGLVTRFDTGVTQVPEPSSIFLMGSALVASVSLLRRRGVKGSRA